MCERLVVVSPEKVIREKYQIHSDVFKTSDYHNPNLGFGDVAPVITSERPKELQFFKFGMYPDGGDGRKHYMTVRSEGDRNQDDSWNYHGIMGIVNSSVFRRYLLSKRCIVVCDAFIYGENTSLPYLVYPRDKKRPFSLAGIWDESENKITGERFKSFALLTIFGNPLWKMIGQARSPVILSRHDQRAWLNPGHVSLGVNQCIKPINYKEFNAYPISAGIKDQTNKGLQLINPVGSKLLEEDNERWARAYNDIKAPRSGRNWK